MDEDFTPICGRGGRRARRGQGRVGRSSSRGRGERGRGSPRRGRGSGSRGRDSGSTGTGTGSRGGGSGSRGRGSRSRSRETDKQQIEGLWRQRKQQMKEVIQSIEADKLRSLVLALIDREPGLVFDLCESEDSIPPSHNPPSPTPSEGMAPSWCKCGRCREMGADIDNKCCGCLPRNCVSTRDEMERLVLDPQVLALGQSFYSDMLARRGQRVENANKTMRYSAYRNFTLWRHGRLGAGVRRVVPSCCVLSIRARYPSATGTYTGFVPGRFV